MKRNSTPRRARAWLPLDVVKAAARAAKERGVSVRARSGGGFYPAYVKARGDHRAMSGRLAAKRDGFVARHMAQVDKRNESVWKGGGPTDRHLALAVWAYSPTPVRLEKWLHKHGYLKQPRDNPGSADRRQLGLLAVDVGPNGGAFLFDEEGRPAGAWAWSWEESTRNGIKVKGSGARLLKRGGSLTEVARAIGWRAAELIGGPFVCVVETTWGDDDDKGASSMGWALEHHTAVRRYVERQPNTWRRRLFADADTATPADLHKALGIVFEQEGGAAVTPRGLRDNRHVWDAFGMGLAYIQPRR